MFSDAARKTYRWVEELMNGKSPNSLYSETKDSYENAIPDDKKKLDMALTLFCTLYTESPEYRSGDTSKPFYKMCCEMTNHCSFFQQQWFYIICTAAGFLFINLISIVIVCVFIRKRKGGGGGGPTGKTSGGPKDKTIGGGKKGRTTGGCDENAIESSGISKSDYG